MIPGLISQELHGQLLDVKNYQNRTNGVEELKHILSGLDMKSVPSVSVQDLICFLMRLLDDSNFKVFYGTLQVLNVLIQKLDTGVEKYFKQIVSVAIKALGDTRTITRYEYMTAFRQLMKAVAPQRILDLVTGNLKHKNSSVREDVLNIITAAMLMHPRKDFNIPKLCFEVAPYLADSKKKVRHATLELFAVFDYCLDKGKKQLLMKAVDMVELNQDAEGLMAAVQARRARHILPKLTSDWMVEYGLVVPKPGQRCPLHSGADLDWVMNGGRISSARGNRTEGDLDRLQGYGSLGSLTDDLPLQRRIVSAGKGKNKLPWEMSSFSFAEKELQCRTPNGTCSEQVAREDVLPLSRKLSPETYVPSFSSAEPQKPHSSGRRASPARLRRSGSLDLNTDCFKTTNLSDSDAVAPKGHMISRNPSVECTISLPSNTSSPGSFLLPSYPLAALSGGMLTPTLSRHHADSPLSMSGMWPNRKECSPHQRDSNPWSDTAGTAKADDLLSRCSPRPLRASLVSSSSTSSFRRALSSNRAPISVSPVIPTAEQFHSHNGQRSDSPGSPQNLQLERNFHLDSDDCISAEQDPPEDDPLDMREMLSSLRSLRNSAAKKRAKVNLNSSDPDSPDSAVRLDLDSPSHTSPMLTSSASESGLSSLSSVANSSINGIKTSPGYSASSGKKSHVTRVPSAKLRSSMSMDFSTLQGLSQRNEVSSEVGVVGQRVVYSNGAINNEEETSGSPSPLLVKPAIRESVRALKPAKGSQSHSNRNSPSTDIPEGVIGRGMFGTAVSPSCLGVALSPEQGDSMAKSLTDRSSGIYSDAQSGSHRNSEDSLRPDEVKQRGKNSRISREKTWLQCLDQQEGQFSPGEHTRDKIRHRVRQMLSDSPTEENRVLIIKDLHLSSSSTLPFARADRQSDESPISSNSPVSPKGPQSPIKCFTPPHQPSPPTVPPNPKNYSRLRRAPSLSRTQPSLSYSSDEQNPGNVGHSKNLSETPELCPFSKPDLVLTQSFDLLSSDDWEKKIEGLTCLRGLAHFHSDTLQSRLHDVCLSLIQEVKNLRSGVSRVAVCTLADLYTHLQRAMDQELEGTVKALLLKAGETNAFIRQDVNGALDCMVQHCTPTRSISALLSGGVGHLNALVRKCAAQHLANLVEKVGPVRLLSGVKDLTDRILPAVIKLAQDSSQEARFFGRRMLRSLSSNPDFDKIIEKYISTKDLQMVRDIVFTLNTKGLGEMPEDTQSARGRRSLSGSRTVRASSLTREPLNQTNRSNSHYSCRTQTLRYQSVADKAEYVKQISGLLGSKDFRDRIKGIDQLTVDCQQNPNMVITSIFPVFDAFRARLLESNSKVNLYALESLQKIIHLLKDNLSQVVNILVPAIVDNHLNSKNNPIYSAAIGAINALVSNLDNMLLLQPLCTKAQFLCGKAKVDLIEKVADLVTELYPRKPQIVEQKVLPLLWHLLGTTTHSGTIHGRGGSVRGATAKLCQALYAQMGSSLVDCAVSQPANVYKGLNELLRTFSYG